MLEIVAEHGPTVAALVAGTATHVAKKVVERRQKNAEFHLKQYLMAYPYQTFLSFMAGVGGYLALLGTGTLSLSSAFLAGVAANSLGDIAPGDR